MDGEAGSVVEGGDLGLQGKAVLGQGASQNKGPLAAAFVFVDAIRSQPHHLRTGPGPRHLTLLRSMCEEADARAERLAEGLRPSLAANR